MMKRFNNTPNKCYTAVEDGKKRFDSRSVAVSAIVIGVDSINDRRAVLLHTRGEGCPDEKGKLSFNCGYLDRDETLEDSVKRELWEELGLYLDELENPYKIIRQGIDDSITGENAVKQNITIRHLVTVDLRELISLIDKGVINSNSEERGGEWGEVQDIILQPLDKNIGEQYEWAFNHGQIFSELKKHYEIY